MAKRAMQFADDGWAIWLDGDEKSTIYMNNWLNLKGGNYVDIGVRIYGTHLTRNLKIYTPFKVELDEIEDLSGKLHDPDVLRGVFNSFCEMKSHMNSYISEINYEGIPIDLIRLDTELVTIEDISEGSLIIVDFDQIKEHFNNEEGYILFRLPHKSLDKLFSTKMSVDTGLKTLVTSPMLEYEYDFSTRINDARLLPPQISNSKELHSQNHKKVLITLSVEEWLNVDSSNCYRVSRVEKNLLGDYVPKSHHAESSITYQWLEKRGDNRKTHYNFHFDISHSSVSKRSIFAYLAILVCTSIVSNTLYEILKTLILK